MRSDDQESSAYSWPSVVAPLRDVESDRLLLRRFVSGDLEELSEVFAQPEVWEFPFKRPFTVDETRAFLDSQIAAWEQRGFGLWAARLRHSGELIGFVGLSVPTFWPEILPAVEVGWRLTPTVWGQGYATEGATAALDEAFATLGLDLVCSLPERENPRSIAVAERLGMQRKRSVTLPPTDRRDAVHAIMFEIERASWAAARGSLSRDGEGEALRPHA